MPKEIPTAILLPFVRYISLTPQEANTLMFIVDDTLSDLEDDVAEGIPVSPEAADLQRIHVKLKAILR